MSRIRPIKKLTKGIETYDGAGVRLVRVIGKSDINDYDPFLMLDAFDSVDSEDYVKGFPWHPHRGIETITYLIKGNIEHGDSLGNTGSIIDGDCQWMTAGSGIIHQEMPKPSERMLGAQLWLNLPAESKMTKPQYGDIKKDKIPVIDESGSLVHIIAGEYIGIPGAFAGSYVKATYLDVELSSGREWFFDTAADATLFIYIVHGDGIFSPENLELISEKQAVLFGEGERFWVRAGERGIRFLLLAAKPLKEPIAWGGPIVMNTREELDLAFMELDNNTFIKD